MKTRKIFFVSLAIIIFLLIVFIVIITFKREKTDQSEINEESMTLNTFEERSLTIREALAKKFSVSEEKVSSFISRESNSHIKGIFFIEDLTRGTFLAIVDEGVNLVWADEGKIDCSVVDFYNFPEEMAPDCF